jgi:DNA polymerase III gamma/tau subunit
MGDGSYRDTLSILQKVLTVSSDKKLTEDEVATVVGAPKSATVNAFLEALAQGSPERALTTLYEATKAGIDVRLFLLLVLTKVRAVLLLRFAPKMQADMEDQFGQEDVSLLTELSGKKGEAIKAQVLSELITAYLEMARAPIASVPLELAIYRLFPNTKE